MQCSSVVTVRRSYVCTRSAMRPDATQTPSQNDADERQSTLNRSRRIKPIHDHGPTECAGMTYSRIGSYSPCELMDVRLESSDRRDAVCWFGFAERRRDEAVAFSNCCLVCWCMTLSDVSPSHDIVGVLRNSLLVGAHSLVGAVEIELLSKALLGLDWTHVEELDGGSRHCDC